MHTEADTKGSPAMHHFSTTSCRLPRTFQWETAHDFEPHGKAQPNRNTHKMGIEIEARRVVGSYSPYLRSLVCSCWTSACSAHRWSMCCVRACWRKSTVHTPTLMGQSPALLGLEHYLPVSKPVKVSSISRFHTQMYSYIGSAPPPITVTVAKSGSWPEI